MDEVEDLAWEWALRPPQLVFLLLPFGAGTDGEEGRGTSTGGSGGVVCSGMDSNGAVGSTSSVLPFSAIVAEGKAGLNGMNRGGGLDTPELERADDGRDGEVRGDMYGDDGLRVGESGPS